MQVFLSPFAINQLPFQSKPQIPVDEKLSDVPDDTQRQPPTYASWTLIVSQYTPTFVTFGVDRLMALSAVAELFRSSYPENFQGAEYHSGCGRREYWSNLREEEL